MALEALEVDLDAGREVDAHDVDEAVRRDLAARHDALHVGALVDDAFGEQETDGEVLVVPGVRIVIETSSSARLPSARE